MKKATIASIIVVVVILALAGYWYLNNTNSTEVLPDTNQFNTNTQVPVQESGSNLDATSNSVPDGNDATAGAANGTSDAALENELLSIDNEIEQVSLEGTMADEELNEIGIQ